MICCILLVLSFSIVFVRCEDGSELISISGTNGTFYCYGVLSNSSYVCSGHGKCTSTNNCSCSGYYYGDQCSEWNCFGKRHTDVSVCRGHGVCEAPNNCSCYDFYSGQECSVYQCYYFNSSDPRACNGGSSGICVSHDNCRCLSGWVGYDCSYLACFGVDSRLPGVCGHNGKCAGPNRCECNSGYKGERCDVAWRRDWIIAGIIITSAVLLCCLFLCCCICPMIFCCGLYLDINQSDQYLYGKGTENDMNEYDNDNNGENIPVNDFGEIGGALNLSQDFDDDSGGYTPEGTPLIRKVI